MTQGKTFRKSKVLNFPPSPSPNLLLLLLVLFCHLITFTSCSIITALWLFYSLLWFVSVTSHHQFIFLQLFCSWIHESMRPFFNTWNKKDKPETTAVLRSLPQSRLPTSLTWGLGEGRRHSWMRQLLAGWHSETCL